MFNRPRIFCAHAAAAPAAAVAAAAARHLWLPDERTCDQSVCYIYSQTSDIKAKTTRISIQTEDYLLLNDSTTTATFKCALPYKRHFFHPSTTPARTGMRRRSDRSLVVDTTVCSNCFFVGSAGLHDSKNNGSCIIMRKQSYRRKGPHVREHREARKRN